MIRKRFRRRNKVIKPKFQLKMAALAIAFLILYSLILGVAVFYPLASEYSTTPDAEYRNQVALSILVIHEHMWPALFCISIVAFIGTILVSHRIAGPMYRFEKTVETLTKGDFSIRIKLRKRDEFHEFAEMMNKLAISLEKRQAEDQSFRKECKESLKHLAREMKSHDDNKAEQLQPIMDQLMAKFNRQIGRNDSIWQQ